MRSEMGALYLVFGPMELSAGLGYTTGTVTALDMTQRRVKVQTAAGQTIVLEVSPAALTGMQVGETFTFATPTSPR